MEAATFAALEELLEDALKCHRLSDADEVFLAGMRGRINRHGRDTEVSDRQNAVLKAIEAKVYACG